MKKIATLLLIAISPFIITACPSTPTQTEPYPSASADSYFGNGGYAEPTATPSSLNDTLSKLRAGILPDPSVTEEEQKLAGILARQVKPDFPLKVGVILYSNYSNLEDKYRKDYYGDFLEQLKANANIGQIIEISNGLITAGADIEELRKLGARFQVSLLLVVNDQYLQPAENKEAVITPIDILTGSRTWESYANIEIYALDILNGVFVFSSSEGFRQSEKYYKEDTIQNKDRIILKESAQEAWEAVADKVDTEINEFRTRISNTGGNK